MVEVSFDPTNDIMEFRLSKKVTAEDYEEILIPAIKKQLKITPKLKVLYHVDQDFDSYEFQAMVDDAKAGMEFFSNWEKIAVVSDIDWLVNSVKLFSFMLPGEIKTFSNKEIEKAKEWLQEEKKPKLNITIDEENKIVTLEPVESLTKEDFIYAKKIIDPFIEKVTSLNGLIIYTQDFSGWESFSALLKHLEFIKEHHKKVQKLAFVTDSFIGEMAEKVGSHFVSAEVKNFDFDALQDAKKWILSN